MKYEKVGIIKKMVFKYFTKLILTDFSCEYMIYAYLSNEYAV